MNRGACAAKLACHATVRSADQLRENAADRIVAPEGAANAWRSVCCRSPIPALRFGSKERQHIRALTFNLVSPRIHPAPSTPRTATSECGESFC
jgi:hypothetical protein